jgi:hypothetical protein
MFDFSKVDFSKIIQRVMRMVRFDATVFKEIEVDEGANTEAMVIVAIVALCGAIGSVLTGGVVGFVWSFISTILLSWLLWSFITYFVGTRLFKGDTNFWEMARLLGYANAPNVLAIFALIPCIGWLAALVGGILSLVLGFLAVREALDTTTQNTIFTVLIGWVVVFVISLIIGGIIGIGAMGLGALTGSGS